MAFAKLDIVAAKGFGILAGVFAASPGRDEALKEDDGLGSRENPALMVSRGLIGVLNCTEDSGLLTTVGAGVAAFLEGDEGGIESRISRVTVASAAGSWQGKEVGMISLSGFNVLSDIVAWPET